MSRKKNKMKKQRFSFTGKIKWLLLSLGFIVIFGLLGYTFILFGGYLIVDEEDLILDAATTIETTDGTVIGSLYHENRTPVELGQVPEHVQDAFVSIEDRRFYDHAGVDFQSVVRAVYKDIIAMDKVEGASTITQQLSKNLFLHNDKTWMRKTKEVMAATYLERQYSKDAILELYINEIYFGNGIYGVENASQRFFSKSVTDLKLHEGALIAGLAQAPNGYSPIEHPERALNRRNIVLQSMENAGVISAETRIQEQGKTLGLDVLEREANPWVESYIDLVMKEASDEFQLSIDELKRGGYQIVVNMDEMAQQIAYEKFNNEEYFPGNTEGAQGAFVMMDQQTGKIVAAIGGREYKLGDFNRVTANRQPGSIMKPLAVYGPAMMKEDYEPYSLIRDQMMDIEGYTATNYDDQYDGAVTIYDALVESKNAAAVWLLDEIGISYTKSYLDKMQLFVPDNGLAIALGGLSEGLSPLDVMTGYRAFANNGETINTFTIDRIYNQENEVAFQSEANTTEVFSPQVAWDMTEMLVRTVNEGTATSGDYSKALAGKTGTTEHPFVNGKTKDAWFVGYTPQYVSAMWMGYDKSDREHYLNGGSEYPTRLTKAILSEMDKQKPLDAAFEKPVNVQELPEPIELPDVTVAEAQYTFGGFSFLKGKLTWTGAEEERVVYHIYKDKPGVDERVGTVEGETVFIIDNVNVLKTEKYYVVPYDPLTKLEGKKSNTVELSL
ncbi:transglycosylase domain-containing protein [Virgibacillus byunsanensis]|uniref:Transglycosylase domain-containing protein n=1 Tax=Virgibacillus byunsanensis TaxID=570945 RepID=A0ABW3LH31_9BACI